MPDVQPRRINVADQFRVEGRLPAEDEGNNFLLSLTRRGECCRSGSQIQEQGIHERKGSQRRSRSMESRWIFDSLASGFSRTRLSTRLLRPFRNRTEFLVCNELRDS